MTEQIENGAGERRGDKGAAQEKTFSSAGESSLAGKADLDSKVVTARGTEDGLVLRIDGKAEWVEILRDIELFLGGKKKFFDGGQVSLEWLDRLPTLEQSKQLEDLLHNEYGIALVVKRKRPSKLAACNLSLAGQIETSSEGRQNPPTTRESGKVMTTQDIPGRQKRSGVTINLFDEIAPGTGEIEQSDPRLSSLSAEDEGNLSDEDFVPIPPGFSQNSSYSSSQSYPGRSASGSRGSGGDLSGDLLGDSAGSKKFASRMAKMLGDDLFYEDDANAKIFFGTLRSGQRLETPFSLIVVGDVNPGADLVAGGDIIVFGGLRVTAHASAYDDDSFDRVIIALQMQPMQLRIGSVISRGSDERVRGAEIARIENRRIIVEQYNPKTLAAANSLGKKLR